jgi:hypothetical protein
MLFLLILEIMTRVTARERSDIKWGLTDSLEDLDYADNICFLSYWHVDLQRKMADLQEAKAARLRTNICKMKEMRINSRTQKRLQIEDQIIEEIDSFTYLGSVMTRSRGALEDINVRINKANAAFLNLRNIWRNKCISSKLRIFKSNVRGVLLYGAET